MEEIWKPVAGFEGLYEVSNLGRIKSLARVIKKGYEHHALQSHSEIILNCSRMKGALRATFYREQKKVGARPREVKRIVWETFVGPLGFNDIIRMKDGDKYNAALDNLFLISRATVAAENRRPRRGKIMEG